MLIVATILAFVLFIGWALVIAAAIYLSKRKEVQMWAESTTAQNADAPSSQLPNSATTAPCNAGDGDANRIFEV